MKEQQVNKLYNKLTPHEQAALVFEAAIRKDENEAELILDSVEMRTCLIPHLDYQQRIQGLSNLSGVYGMVFWKTLFLLSTSMWVHFEEDNFYEIAKTYIKRINSIDAALTAICEQLNIDTSIVKQVAECRDFQPDFGDEIDNQFIEQYKELFTTVTYLHE